MIARLTTAAVVILSLSACKNTSLPNWELDRTLYQQAYLACANSLPAGPKSAVYNDWDEVVGECREMARLSALVCTANCSPGVTPRTVR